MGLNFESKWLNPWYSVNVTVSQQSQNHLEIFMKQSIFLSISKRLLSTNICLPHVSVSFFFKVVWGYIGYTKHISDLCPGSPKRHCLHELRILHDLWTWDRSNGISSGHWSPGRPMNQTTQGANCWPPQPKLSCSWLETSKHDWVF